MQCIISLYHRYERVKGLLANPTSLNITRAILTNFERTSTYNKNSELNAENDYETKLLTKRIESWLDIYTRPMHAKSSFWQRGVVDEVVSLHFLPPFIKFGQYLLLVQLLPSTRAAGTVRQLSRSRFIRYS